MKQDIRTKTCLVIERNGEYLSRIEMLTGRVIWDNHLSSAWKTRDKAKAIRMAKVYGGQLSLFNPIIWRVKAL